MQIPVIDRGLKLSARVCDGLGINFEWAENAPSSTLNKCRHCASPPGTLGDLRSLSTSGKRDIFEIRVADSGSDLRGGPRLNRQFGSSILIAVDRNNKQNV
jgi:hypothetical protein